MLKAKSLLVLKAVKMLTAPVFVISLTGFGSIILLSLFTVAVPELSQHVKAICSVWFGIALLYVPADLLLDKLQT